MTTAAMSIAACAHGCLAFQGDRLPIRQARGERIDANHFGKLPVLEGIAPNEDEIAAMVRRFERLHTAVVGSAVP